MKLLGYDLSIQKAVPTGQSVPTPATLTPPDNRGGFFATIVREAFPGAWQKNIEWRRETALTYHAVYACVSLIASDVSKCRPRIVEMDKNEGIWEETTVSAFSPVLRKPNRYQNRIKFFEQWVTSKLIHGNTYVLKEYDDRGVVSAMYILDPNRVKVLVSTDGSVYYQLMRDNLSGVDQDDIVVPAEYIIHDVMVPLYHPLCGVSPLTACGIAAVQGLSIQNNSAKFFANGSQPGGILTAPHTINDTTAARIKEHFLDKFMGENTGKIAVLGDGLKYESITMRAIDSQLIEQLKWTADVVCSAYHVPPYKIGVGTPPAHTNIEALEQSYYSQCLQILFETIELCLDEGLGLTSHKDHVYGVEFDLDDLLRMDTLSLMDVQTKGVGAGVVSPDEARKKLGLRKTKGGQTPYLQQQNYSLAALDARDRSDDPFGKTSPGGDGKSNFQGGADGVIDGDKSLTVESAKAMSVLYEELPDVV